MFTFYTSDPCDLDLQPYEFKINRVLVFTKTNQHVKYDSSVITSYQKY